MLGTSLLPTFRWDGPSTTMASPYPLQTACEVYIKGSDRAVGLGFVAPCVRVSCPVRRALMNPRRQASSGDSGLLLDSPAVLIDTGRDDQPTVPVLLRHVVEAETVRAG